MNEFTVEQNYKGWRLDKFLTEKTNQTRSQLRKQILAGFVLVNDKPSKVHRFLEMGDKVTVKSQKSIVKSQKIRVTTQKPKTFSDKIKSVFTGGNAHSQPKGWGKPRVLEKTKDYLIVEKPAGMLIHSTEKGETDTLVDWLIKKFPETKKLEDPVELKKGKGQNTLYRPGIIHRLDRDVSGLVLIPRNLDAFEHFKNQFKQRTIYKEYIALVHGQMSEDAGKIEFEISRSKSGGRMAAHPRGSGKGKPALTEFEALERFQKFTLVKVKPKTGRTNQIRVHFFAMGHPIVGDQVYTQKQTTKFKISRPFLHATKLVFKDLNDEQQTFESALPAELASVIDELPKN